MMSSDEKWAANIAFTGNKETIKKILNMLEQLEDSGDLKDCTSIDGPYNSLQQMLKTRVENLSLEAKGEPAPQSEDKKLDEEKPEKK